MSSTSPASLESEDFEAIEDAVMETARGRWFLREYGRRARGSDTSRLLEALERIERLVANGQGTAPPPVFDADDHARALEERQGRLAEIAWTLRERGYDGDVCGMIEKEARAIARLARTMRGVAPGEAPPRLVERRAIAAPTPVEPAGELDEGATAPAAEAEIDEAPLPVVALPATVEAPVAAAPARDWREVAATALAPIDRMSTREKLAFFA